MTQRLVLSALTVLTAIVFGASPAQSGQKDGAFYDHANLDITQVETEDERMESCDLIYIEGFDTLVCK